MIIFAYPKYKRYEKRKKQGVALPSVEWLEKTKEDASQTYGTPSFALFYIIMYFISYNPTITS